MSDSDDTTILVAESTFRTMRHFPNWAYIKGLLQQMADGLMNSGEILNAIAKFRSISMQNKYEKQYFNHKTSLDKLMEVYD